MALETPGTAPGELRRAIERLDDALGDETSSAEAYLVLAQAFTHPDDRVASAVLNVMENHEAYPPTAQLIARLSSSDEDLRCQCLYALAYTGGETAARALLAYVPRPGEANVYCDALSEVIDDEVDDDPLLQQIERKMRQYEDYDD